MESRRACSRKPCKQQFWKTFCLAYFKFGAAFRPSSLSLEDTHQLRQFSLFGKLFVDDDICRSSFLHLFDVQLVVRDILGDIVMSFSKLTDYPTLVAHRSVKLQIWGKMLIVKTRICMTARNSIQHPSKRYTADTSFGGGGGGGGVSFYIIGSFCSSKQVTGVNAAPHVRSMVMIIVISTFDNESFTRSHRVTNPQ